MDRRVRLAVYGLAAGVFLAALGQPVAARQAEPVTETAWLHWLGDQARSFDHRTAKSALAVEVHAESPTPIDLRGVVNANGSSAVSFTTAGSSFDARCIDDHSCWLRQSVGGPDLLWHRVSAHELSSLRRALPDVDGFLAPGVACSLVGSTGSLDYDVDGTRITASISFAGGAFRLSERLSVVADGVDVTVFKSLTPAKAVSVKRPGAALIGAPMVQDVVPELP